FSPGPVTICAPGGSPEDGNGTTTASGDCRNRAASHYGAADDVRAGVPSIRLLAVPCLRNDTDRVAGDPNNAEPRFAWRSHVRVCQAAAVDLVRLRTDRVLRVADSGHWRLIQQPDHGPDARVRQHPGCALAGARLRPSGSTVAAIRPAGRVVDPREPFVLAAA